MKGAEMLFFLFLTFLSGIRCSLDAPSQSAPYQRGGTSHPAICGPFAPTVPPSPVGLGFAIFAKCWLETSPAC